MGKETDQRLVEIKEIGDKSGGKVVEDLLNAVSDVRPEKPDRIDVAA